MTGRKLSLRKRLWKRGRNTCRYCGRILGKGELTADHTKPKVNGGTNNLGNIVPACRSCNQKKGAMSVAKFLQHRIFTDPESGLNKCRRGQPHQFDLTYALAPLPPGTGMHYAPRAKASPLSPEPLK